MNGEYTGLQGLRRVNMKKISLFTLFLLLSQFTYSQSLPLPTLENGWERITIENIGSFDMPPTMELQGGAYQTIKRNLVGNILKMRQSTFQIIVQQKGLNNFSGEGFSRYARIMFKTETGSSDPELVLDFDTRSIPQSDISGLSDLYKGAAQLEFSNTGLKLLEWYPLQVEKINGMTCIHTSYKRQLDNNEPVIVHHYQFFNYDYDHTFMLSYRLNEKDYWENDFGKVLNSLRIRKRR
jgi:hypothetical protein